MRKRRRENEVEGRRRKETEKEEKIENSITIFINKFYPRSKPMIVVANLR